MKKNLCFFIVIFILFINLYGIVIKEEIKNYKEYLLETRKKLDDIRKKISEEREKIAKEKAKEKTTAKYLQRLEKEIDITKKELAVFDNNIKVLDEMIFNIEEDIKGKEKFIKEKENEVKEIIRKYYKNKSREYFDLLLQSRNFDDFIIRYKFYKILTKKNISDIESYKITLEKLKEDRQALLDYKKEVNNLKEIKKMEWEKYKNQKWEKFVLLKNIKRNISKSQQIVEELKQNEKKLNQFIEKLQVSVELEDKEAREAFTGYKGKFPWPVDSRKILAGFGYFNHPRFKSKVLSNGIHIEERYNAPVYSIFKGVVKYADWFDGYGKMIIIDHGGGYFSIYAHLSEFYVREGDRVNIKSLIGRTGDTESFFGNELYFELREKTRPLNPLKYLVK